jgi:hypothetical protein
LVSYGLFLDLFGFDTFLGEMTLFGNIFHGLIHMAKEKYGESWPCELAYLNYTTLDRQQLLALQSFPKVVVVILFLGTN